MKYKEIADILYGQDLKQIYHIINQSLDAPEFEQRINSMVIHTGFIFITERDKRLILLYDLSTETVIRQLSDDHLPQLNGLLVVKVNAKNFNIAIPLFFSHIKANNEVYQYHHVEINNGLESNEILISEKGETTTISSVKVLEASDLTSLTAYPLRKTLTPFV